MPRARIAAALAIAGVGLSTALWAQETGVLTNVSFTLNGQERSITQSAEVEGELLAALYDRPADCEGICVAPMQVAEDVATIGELDVIDFIATSVVTGAGLLIDSRMPEDRSATITGSVNVPGALLGDDNPFRSDILVALGARQFEGVYNFADAIPLVVFDNGPTDDAAAAMVVALVDLGYPVDRIEYYRGGVQVWAALGLTTEEL